jgi:hypothetical protein
LVQSWQYSPGGFLKSFTKEGVNYRVRVDGFGRIIETINDLGVIQRKGYDRLNRVLWSAVYEDTHDPSVSVYRLPQFGDSGLVTMTEYAYDNIGRVTQVSRWHLEDQTKRIRTTVYDDSTRTVTVIEGDRTSSVQLDGAGRVATPSRRGKRTSGLS